MMINIVIAFMLSVVLVFCVDAFVRHPIPAQKGEQFGMGFDLSKTDTAYADATVLDQHRDTYSNIYLVEQDGQMHLLYFRAHFYTQRQALISDVVVEGEDAQAINVGDKFTSIRVEVENGEIANIYGASTFYERIYFLMAAVLTAVESLILWLFLRKKYPN